MIKIIYNYFSKSIIFIEKKIRGIFCKFVVLKKCGKNLLIGKNVTIINGDYLSIGDNCEINDNTYIDAKATKGISIGNHVTLNRNCYLHCFGDRKGEGIRIGNSVIVGINTQIYGHALVTIGNNCAIGPNVIIVPENHNYIKKSVLIRKQGCTRQPIIICDDVWIGTHSVILAGVTIGKGAVVAAGSVVTKNIPENYLAGGVPAKIIKSRI